MINTEIFLKQCHFSLLFLLLKIVTFYKYVTLLTWYGFIIDIFKINIGERKLGRNQKRLGEPSDQSEALTPRKGEKEGCREGGKAWGEEGGRNGESWQARSILDGRAVLGRVREDHYGVFKPKSLASRLPHLSGQTWLNIPASPSHWLEAVPGSNIFPSGALGPLVHAGHYT